MQHELLNVIEPESGPMALQAHVYMYCPLEPQPPVEAYELGQKIAAEGMTKKQRQEAAETCQSFFELPPEVQWQVAKCCEWPNGCTILRVSRDIRDLLINRCSSIRLHLDSDAGGYDISAAGCFLRRACLHGRDGLKLSITGLLYGRSLPTLLCPSLNAGGLSKVHDLSLRVGKLKELFAAAIGL
jgi:hypothetical protein